MSLDALGKEGFHVPVRLLAKPGFPSKYKLFRGLTPVLPTRKQRTSAHKPKATT